MRSVTVVFGPTKNRLYGPPRSALVGAKYFVSITSVSCSHQPIESPSHETTAAGPWDAFMRMTRAS
jgi:hypothetical protein